jgi:Fe-S cluster assembly iron-binding protein IscA
VKNDLTLSPAAHAAISRLTSLRHATRAGLRIAPQYAGSSRLQVSIADAPEAEDLAAVHGSARVYCEPAAAARLRGGRLDVQRNDRGKLEFVVRHGPSTLS